MTDTDRTFAPLVFFEYDHQPGSYCLQLSDSHMVEVMDVFEECDQYGNGYGWTGVARSVIQAEAPELADRVDFDPEAGTFVAHGTDPEALRRLGVLLQAAFRDRTRLAALIRSGDPDWFD